MIGKFRNLKLIAVVFVFSALIQGCSSESSSGNSAAPANTSSSTTTSDDSTTTSAPAATDAEMTAVKTLLSFSQAIKKGDFQEFHQTQVAESAKNELTVTKLNETFAQFITDKTDISPKVESKINWSSQPEVTDNSMNLNGNYSGSSGKTVEFKFQYVKEKNSWGIKAIEIKTS